MSANSKSNDDFARHLTHGDPKHSSQQPMTTTRLSFRIAPPATAPASATCAMTALPASAGGCSAPVLTVAARASLMRLSVISSRSHQRWLPYPTPRAGSGVLDAELSSLRATHTAGQATAISVVGSAFGRQPMSNHARQRTRPSHHCCNGGVPWAGLLSLGR